MYKAGFVALIGQPNVGKSTLTNILAEGKVSIVSNKPQTTRNRVRAVVSEKIGQIVFVDAPGVLKSTSGINTYLQEEIQSVLKGADVALIVIDHQTPETQLRQHLEMVKARKIPFVVVVNKLDEGSRGIKALNVLLEERLSFLPVSAAKRPKEARTLILEALWPVMPQADAPLYDTDLLTLESTRQVAAELVREACFQSLREEVPYGLAIRIAKYEEVKSKKIGAKIYCDIIVDREGHKGIVIGHKGQMLKQIGVMARGQIEKLVDHPVFLGLHVDVRKDWSKNPRTLKELGYVVTE